MRDIIRVIAFVRKEIVNVLRQPRLVFTLILGPFLILLLFGIGYRETPRVLKTLFVVADDSPMRALTEDYGKRLGEQFEYAGIISDPEEANRRLRSQEVDLVIVVPTDPESDISHNQQATFNVYHYEIDPYERTYVEILARNYTDEINRQALRRAIEEGKVEAGQLQAEVEQAQQSAAVTRRALEEGDAVRAQASAEQLDQDLNVLALAAGGSLALLQSAGAVEGTSAGTLREQLDALRQSGAEVRTSTASTSSAADIETLSNIETSLADIDATLARYQQVDSTVLVSPFTSQALSVTDVNVTPTDFYVPAVIALLMQHIAVTLAGLSIVRERQDGPIELFRAAPVTAFQTLVGKFIGYLLLTSVLTIILTLLIIYGLGVPMLGSWWAYGLALFVLLCASLSLGFFISLVARSDSQAIQYAMIILLASIFFSGFFLALYRLWGPVRALSWTLPVTYGIDMLQSVMLRGRFPSLLLLGILGLYALVLFLIDWWRMARVMARQ